MKEFLKNRDHDLLAAAQKVISGLGASVKPRLQEVAVAAINSSAPHYYLTLDYAYRRLRQYRRNPVAFGGESLSAIQLREIFAKVDAIKARYATVTDEDALMRVLSDSRASRFFLSEAYAIKLIRILIYKQKNQKRK